IIRGLKVTTMCASLINDITYMVIGGVYPNTENSAFGVGLVTSSTDGIELRSGNTFVPDGKASWGSNDLFVSYGVNVPEANMQFGGSVKYISQGGSGFADSDKALASGISFDFGSIYSPNEIFSLAAVAQNPLGARLSNGNNLDQSIESLYKLGAVMRTRPFDTRKMNVALDADFGSSRPTTYHLGVEYFPNPVFAIRLGLDQDPSAQGVQTNPTAGIGLRVSGFEFNYAYHPYCISSNDTHYFSFGYVGKDEENIETFTVYYPEDRSIIYDDNIKVAGRLRAGFNGNVTVNGMEVPFEVKTGEFSCSVPVSNIGKKMIEVETTKSSG
ncbi:MAG: hypothetical protein KKH83_06240, partial [Candidatus Margulisbacteria bacterium]|nr:hypothetical protein [Candidatus Margulisiibacteriota bacterium]